MTPYDLQVMGHAVKTAAPLGRAATLLLRHTVPTSAAIGAGLGALGGAAGNKEDRFHGALRGAVLGGVSGAAARGLGGAIHDAHLLNPYASTTKTVIGGMRRAMQAPVHFAKRQVHGLTGAYADRPGDIGLRSSATAEKKIDLLRRRHHALGGDAAAHTEAIKALREEGRRGDAALKHGLTHLPGLARGLAKHPKETAKALLHEVGGARGAAFSVGIPLALSAPDIARGDESAKGGRSMRQKLVGLGTNIAGGAVTAGLPILPQLAGAVAIDAAGQKVLGHRPRREALEAANRQLVELRAQK